MKKVVIYTDGACSGNPGKGGWGAVLIYGKIEREISGSEEETTNNKMELTACVESLKLLKEPCEVELFSDSAYVVNAFNDNWIEGWIKNDWKNSQKKPVANKEIWQELIALTEKHRVTFNKVKGHAGDKYNEICDALATGRR
ncbi:MAG: ribonuclease HI [Clostridia bacterium]|nr:ribonuclease HI [Clostridia bacterium]